AHLVGALVLRVDGLVLLLDVLVLGDDEPVLQDGVEVGLDVVGVLLLFVLVLLCLLGSGGSGGRAGRLLFLVLFSVFVGDERVVGLDEVVLEDRVVFIAFELFFVEPVDVFLGLFLEALVVVLCHRFLRGGWGCGGTLASRTG